MDERSALILRQLIQEYINTGQPVGSKILAGTIHFSISPATIRLRLRSLERAGYLEQPHTSAGRLPTDRGYRYFVNQQLHFYRPSTRRLTTLARRLRAVQLIHPHLNRAIAQLLAQLSRNVALCGCLPSCQVQEAGLADVFAATADIDHSTLQELSLLLKRIDAHLSHLAKMSQDHTHVFIGQENPVIKATRTSLMVRTTKIPKGEQVVLMLLGPKRMSYQRNIDILDSLAELFEHVRL